MSLLDIPKAGWETEGLNWIGSVGKVGNGRGSGWGDRVSRILTLKDKAEDVALGKETKKSGFCGLGRCSEDLTGIINLKGLGSSLGFSLR